MACSIRLSIMLVILVIAKLALMLTYRVLCAGSLGYTGCTVGSGTISRKLRPVWSGRSMESWLFLWCLRYLHRTL